MIVLFVVTTLVTSIGWYRSTHPGRGNPPSCYTLTEGRILEVETIHGVATTSATFTVKEESDGDVMVGYWEDVEGGIHTLQGLPGHLSYYIGSLQGQVVDPSGNAIPEC